MEVFGGLTWDTKNIPIPDVTFRHLSNLNPPGKLVYCAFRLERTYLAPWTLEPSTTV
jgi:hypothetical protein